ncbi:integral membrane protein TerC [Barrientosiimonas endolithica]|uniref:Integral membrane protein TerC n=2 Tax=Barrientosiimonas endolithica TaxID=1535208 RepID=A0ABN6YMH3_9MICO|nr:integral membrane protein TerC [Barrientosiimonas endolithica]
MAFANSFAPMWVIGLVVAATILILIFDVVVLGRRPHVPSNRETGLALGIYISLALLFGVYVFVAGGGQLAGEYFAGWLTEYSLSIDNLFVFLIIMAKFNVPRQYQQYALLVGIVIALILRAIFILIGAQAINAAAWIFYIFGAFLIYTAIKLAKEYAAHEEEHDEGDNAVVKFAKKRLPFTDSWDAGTKIRTLDSKGAKVYTPMFLVILALGTTDLLFALDSIPAIFGLTQDPFLVLMANIFALMGLRQLYFLIGGLLKKLVYLSLGLSVLLAFIGVKLILHALHENNLPFVNGGEGLPVPEVPIWLSLTVIVGILVVTAIASLVKTRRDERINAAG